MKKVGIVLVLFAITISCNTSEKSKNTVSSKAVNEGEIAIEAEEIIVSDVVRKARVILKKRVNTDTFIQDVLTIEDAGFYSPEVCQALIRSFQASRGFPSNKWTMTYEEALTAAQQGIEKSKMINDIADKRNI